MTEETFDCCGKYCCCHCPICFPEESNLIDKQKVRDVIDEVREFDACGEPGCCDRILSPEEIKNTIKKELGL